MLRLRQYAKIIKIMSTTPSYWFDVMTVVFLDWDKFAGQETDAFDGTVLADSEHGQSTVLDMLRSVD